MSDWRHRQGEERERHRRLDAIRQRLIIAVGMHEADEIVAERCREFLQEWQRLIKG